MLILSSFYQYFTDWKDWGYSFDWNNVEQTLVGLSTYAKASFKNLASRMQDSTITDAVSKHAMKVQNYLYNYDYNSWMNCELSFLTKPFTIMDDQIKKIWHAIILPHDFASVASDFGDEKRAPYIHPRYHDMLILIIPLSIFITW